MLLMEMDTLMHRGKRMQTSIYLSESAQFSDFFTNTDQKKSFDKRKMKPI